jgi:hypothetical protein
VSDPSSASAKPRSRFHGRLREARPGTCEWPGCDQPGEYKAPRSRNAEQDGYHWFCLDHVRQFNATYDFFKGMTPEEIAAAQRPIHPSWERKTWPFAGNADPAAWDLSDRLDILREQPGFARFAERPAPHPVQPHKPLSRADRAALATLGLEPQADADAIKAAYKGLVRRFHPDANGGDRSTEPQLRKVIDAYTHLMKSVAG